NSFGFVVPASCGFSAFEPPKLLGLLIVNSIFPFPSFASGSYLSVHEYRVPSFLMDGGLNLRPSPFGLLLSTIHGVTFVPHAWFLSVTNWSVRRAPAPAPANRKPRVSRRPFPVFSALNQPKNTPLEPEVAVMAKLPDAANASFKVLGETFAA